MPNRFFIRLPMNSVCKQFCSASASASHNVGRLPASLSRSSLRSASARVCSAGPSLFASRSSVRWLAEGSLIHNQAVLCRPCKQGAKRLLFSAFDYPISHGKDKASVANVYVIPLSQYTAVARLWDSRLPV